MWREITREIKKFNKQTKNANKVYLRFQNENFQPFVDDDHIVIRVLMVVVVVVWRKVLVYLL